jgi:hypothetical protein
MTRNRRGRRCKRARERVLRMSVGGTSASSGLMEFG